VPNNGRIKSIEYYLIIIYYAFLKLMSKTAEHSQLYEHEIEVKK
jgi:hypothetical protein